MCSETLFIGTNIMVHGKLNEVYIYVYIILLGFLAIGKTGNLIHGLVKFVIHYIVTISVL